MPTEDTDSGTLFIAPMSNTENLLNKVLHAAEPKNQALSSLDIGRNAIVDRPSSSYLEEADSQSSFA